MFTKILLLVVSVAICNGSTTPNFGLQFNWDVETHFKAFKHVYNKNYPSDYEESRRLDIFKENMNFVSMHNKLYQSGYVSYHVALNEFADMPSEEFRQRNGFLGEKKALHLLMSNGEADSNDKKRWVDPVGPGDVAPTLVDWRTKGAVTPVKNQGACGSCYTFSSTGSLEGQHYLKTGKLVSLSEQNLVDCSENYNNNGCGGGLMDNCFKYVHANKGIDTERSYPYTAEAGTCNFKPNYVGADDEGFVDIPTGNETALKHAVAKIGPISVAIDAAAPGFQFYHGGVYSSYFCYSDMKHLDHGVLAVGYGTDTDSGKDYWLVKNSWGASWGDAGYIKMARNDNNMCGIATCASYPIVDSNGAEKL